MASPVRIDLLSLMSLLYYRDAASGKQMRASSTGLLHKKRPRVAVHPLVCVSMYYLTRTSGGRGKRRPYKGLSQPARSLAPLYRISVIAQALSELHWLHTPLLSHGLSCAARKSACAWWLHWSLSPEERAKDCEDELFAWLAWVLELLRARHRRGTGTSTQSPQQPMGLVSWPAGWELPESPQEAQMISFQNLTMARTTAAALP